MTRPEPTERREQLETVRDTVAALFDLGATSVKVEVTRGGTVKAEASKETGKLKQPLRIA